MNTGSNGEATRGSISSNGGRTESNANRVGSEEWLSQPVTRREALWIAAQCYMLGKDQSLMHDVTGLLTAKAREIEGDAGIFYERLIKLLQTGEPFENIWRDW